MLKLLELLSLVLAPAVLVLLLAPGLAADSEDSKAYDGGTARVEAGRNFGI